MKKRLIDFLICPGCLPREVPLKCIVDESDGNEIVSGNLICKSCSGKYPIAEGIPVLLPEPDSAINRYENRYETQAVVSAYLWSHYADILGESDAHKAYSNWAEYFTDHVSLAVDAGCAVGRFAFELSKKSDFTVGLDMSFAFIRLARKLLKKRTIDFELITEGLLTKQKTITLDETWAPDAVEFIVGDVTAMPFSQNTFSMLATLNILDKVSKPLKHLQEMNRIAKTKEAQLLFSDPFSWSTEYAQKDDWLGGKSEGTYTGKSLDNIRRLFKGQNQIILPPWNIKQEDAVQWKIRNHQNHYENITSELIISTR